MEMNMSSNCYECRNNPTPVECVACHKKFCSSCAGWICSCCNKDVCFSCATLCDECDERCCGNCIINTNPLISCFDCSLTPSGAGDMSQKITTCQQAVARLDQGNTLSSDERKWIIALLSDHEKRFISLMFAVLAGLMFLVILGVGVFSGYKGISESNADGRNALFYFALALFVGDSFFLKEAFLRIIDYGFPDKKSQ